jgi:hypothetical protein
MFSVPPDLAANVTVEQLNDGSGWQFTFVSATRPTLKT